MTQANGHHSNGHHSNGQPDGTGTSTTAVKNDKSLNWNLSPLPDRDKSVVLQQSPSWSRGVVWTIVGVAITAIVWSWFARIEQVVQAKGQLKPQGAVKEIQAPLNGVVKEVKVKDGDRVRKGQELVILDSEAAFAQLQSLQQILKETRQENQFYSTLMAKPLDPSQVERAIVQLGIPSEIASLARNRTALVSENQFFEIQLGRPSAGTALDLSQLSRLKAANKESVSRSLAAQLEVSQLQKQLSQNQVKLADARVQLITDRAVLAEIKARNDKAIRQTEKSLEIEKGILSDVEPLLEEGAMAKYQINKQRQSVSDRSAELIEKKANGLVEYNKQQQQIQDRLAQIGQFSEEEQRLEFAIAQAGEKLTNTEALTEKDVRDKIGENQKRIAEIDSQLTKVIVENNKKIAELESQMSQARQTLKYQKLLAPVGGIVFDLKAYPGYVPPNAQMTKDQAVLKIVPDDHLIAEVDVTNQDIGFVRPGQKVDVRMDTFPFSEFGDIKGEVLSIGSDALPPDENHRYYRFPTKIKLNEQELKAQDRTIPLQSGMAVTINVKIREDRTVWDLFTELFDNQVDNLKKVR